MAYNVQLWYYINVLWNENCLSFTLLNVSMKVCKDRSILSASVSEIMSKTQDYEDLNRVQGNNIYHNNSWYKGNYLCEIPII